MSEWQPIETAPIPADDGYGPWILVQGHTNRTSANMQVVRWDGEDWESSDDGYGAYIKPTHWMPLPLPPQIEGFSSCALKS